MKLKQRIWMLPLVATLIFSVGVAVVAWFSQRTSSTIADLGSSAYPYLDGVTEFAGQLDALVTTVQSAVAEGEKERLRDVDDRTRAMMAVLDKLQAVPGKAEPVRALRAQFAQYSTSALQAASILLGATPGDRAKAIERMQETYKVLAAGVSSAREQARGAMDQGLASARKGVALSLTAMVVSALCVFVVLAIGSLMLSRTLWRQIGGEPAYACGVLQRMAQGDLSQHIVVDSGGDRSLLGAVRQMSMGLAGIVSSVRDGSDSMASASSEIATGNQDLSHRTELTASNLQQTASSVTQLTSMVHHAAESARTANQLAVAAAGAARKGGEVVAEVVSTMDEINASSRKISDIIGVIDGIAFQTNILALNAAVEAARAGDQGRGFAVVAGEVRSLAQRSAEAAREIKTLIGNSVAKVDAGARLVTDAGETMTEIVSSVLRVSDVVGEISSAAAEQSEGISQVDSAVGQLDQMTQQNAALVEQSAAAAHSLREQATRLAGVVATFKLPEPSAPAVVHSHG